MKHEKALAAGRRPRVRISLNAAAILIAGAFIMTSCDSAVSPLVADEIPPVRLEDGGIKAPGSHALYAVLTSNAFEGEREAAEAPSFTVPLQDLPGGVLAGEVVYVGRGCPAGAISGGSPEDPYLADPAGHIALIVRGSCRFDHKIARAQMAGATAVIVFNFDESLILMGGDNPVLMPDGSLVLITIAGFSVRQSTGFLLRDGMPPVTVLITPPAPATPMQLLDHVYEGVDEVHGLGSLSDGQLRSLVAQLDATRRHLLRGNHKGAANTLGAFINHVNSLEAEGVLSDMEAAYLRNLANAVLNAL
jgi:hypothetical protein